MVVVTSFIISVENSRLTSQSVLSTQRVLAGRCPLYVELQTSVPTSWLSSTSSTTWEKLIPSLSSLQPTVRQRPGLEGREGRQAGLTPPVWREKGWWRETRARSRDTVCWWCRTCGWWRISFTIMICIFSMSRPGAEWGGPAKTTQSWGLSVRLEMQEEVERREVGERTVAVQETFSLTWKTRASEGQGSESAGQSPHSEEVGGELGGQYH